MKHLLFICVLALAACATDAQHAATSMSDGSVMHTIRCEDSWDSCYLTAAQICGERGFEEVSRNLDSGLSSAGRLERMHTVEGGIERHRYSENPREEGYNRMITIRCGKTR